MKIPKRTLVGTDTDLNRLQLIPKRTSMGTRKGRVGYDRSDPNKIMCVWVGRYVGRYSTAKWGFQFPTHPSGQTFCPLQSHSRLHSNITCNFMIFTL